MHEHFSGPEAVKVFLYVVVLFGAANLTAMKFAKSSSLAASWCNLFGLDA